MVYDVIKKRYRSSDKGIAKVMQWVWCGTHEQRLPTSFLLLH